MAAFLQFLDGPYLLCQVVWACTVPCHLAISVALVVQLIDSRHKPSKDDYDMLNFLKSGGYKTVIALTKIDKLNKTERAQRLEAFKTELADFPDYETVPFSSQTGEGVDTLRKIITSAAE